MSDDDNSAKKLKEMTEQLFGNNENRNEEMVNKIADSMLKEFTAMLGQVAFNILLNTLDENKQQQAKDQVYNTWKSRIQSSITEVDEKDLTNNLDSILGVDNLPQKAFELASQHVQEYLNTETNTGK